MAHRIGKIPIVFSCPVAASLTAEEIIVRDSMIQKVARTIDDSVLASPLLSRESPQQKLMSYIKEKSASTTHKLDAGKQQIKNLVFSGGGSAVIPGIRVLKALQQFYKGFDITKVQKVTGASAGAVAALLVSLNKDGNLDVTEKMLLEHFPKNRIRDWSFSRVLKVILPIVVPILSSIFKINIDNVQNRINTVRNKTVNFFKFFWLDITKYRFGQRMMSIDVPKYLKPSARESYSVFKGEVLEKWLHDVLKNKTGKDSVTFKDLADAGFKDLNVICSDLNNNRSVCFNKDKTPNVEVVKALMASMAIPFVFPAKHFSRAELGMQGEGSVVCGDAFISSCNYHIDDEDDAEETIGVLAMSPQECSHYYNGQPFSVNDHLSFLGTFLNQLLRQGVNRDLAKARKITVASSTDKGLLDFDWNKTELANHYRVFVDHLIENHGSNLDLEKLYKFLGLEYTQEDLLESFDIDVDPRVHTPGLNMLSSIPKVNSKLSVSSSPSVGSSNTNESSHSSTSRVCRQTVECPW